MGGGVRIVTAIYRTGLADGGTYHGDVPSIVKLLAHPELRRPSPPPQRVDLRRVILAGLAAWLVALVVFGVLTAVGRTSVEVLATCAAGLLLGGAGLLWERRHRREYRGED